MTCRSCNFSKPNLKDLYQVSYDDDGSKATLASKLEAISGILINKEDPSPKTICFQCKLILEMAFEFQKMIQKNEQMFCLQMQEVNSDAEEIFEEEEFLDDQSQKYIEQETNAASPDLDDSLREATLNISCEDCGKNFHTKNALDLHRKLIHKKSLSSPSQKRDSPALKYIKTENSRISNEEPENEDKPFCTICEKHFHTEKALLLHAKIKHKGV